MLCNLLRLKTVNTILIRYIYDRQNLFLDNNFYLLNYLPIKNCFTTMFMF